MITKETNLPGVLILQPRVFGDERGYFLESYHAERFAREVGVNETFVQDNYSRSAQSVLRGLHFQVKKPQGKLVNVTNGEVFDVTVDIDPESATFKQWFGVTLTGDNHLQLYIPPGYAHGFAVLSESADFQYKCTDFYDPTDEAGIIWNDPSIDIDWPFSNPSLSDKDQTLPNLDTYLKLAKN